jgi:hypothetical protein
MAARKELQWADKAVKNYMQQRQEGALQQS